MSAADFPPIEQLVAHADRMLLIDRVLAADDGWVTVAASVDPDAWYADADGSMPAWVGIELMAQGIAAWVGLKGWRAGRPPKCGFLLGTRSYTSRQPAFNAGSKLEITATETYREANGLAAFDCTLSISGEVLAEASLKVFEPVDFDAFMEQQRQ